MVGNPQKVQDNDKKRLHLELLIKTFQQKYNRDLRVAYILPIMCNFCEAGKQEFYKGLCKQYEDLMLPHPSPG